jgi:hypothetical protein
VRRRNLLLVTYKDGPIEQSLGEVARFVREIAPEIRAHVVGDRRYRLQRIPLALRPTLVFSPTPLRRLRLLRGVVYQGRSMPKSREFELLAAQGVPVPRWTRLTEDAKPDLSGFGPYVVVKPEFGMRGGRVRIVRKDRVRWKPEQNPFDPHNRDSLVQEFIYTGKWPVTYRVSTLFGAVLYAMRGEGNHARRPLLGRYAFSGGPRVGGASIVGSARDSEWSLSDDPEVLAMAQRAHAAFPGIPLLGVDVIRDAETGKLYVLETNPDGWTWHFTSRDGLAGQKQFGFDLAGQFDGLRKAARILAEKTRSDAI